MLTQGQVKIEWLRSAVKQGTDDIERGDFVILRSDRDIDALVDQVRREVDGSSLGND